MHCPLFPDIKQEYWWVYICDRKSQTLLTTPVHVTSLAHFEEVQLRFTAPRWPGVYTFTVCLRSDSYLGFDQAQDIKVCNKSLFISNKNLKNLLLCSWMLKKHRKYPQNILSGIFQTKKLRKMLMQLMNIPSSQLTKISATMNNIRTDIQEFAFSTFFTCQVNVQ